MQLEVFSDHFLIEYDGDGKEGQAHLFSLDLGCGAAHHLRIKEDCPVVTARAIEGAIRVDLTGVDYKETGGRGGKVIPAVVKLPRA
jgi:hypothetical protein